MSIRRRKIAARRVARKYSAVYHKMVLVSMGIKVKEEKKGKKIGKVAVKI